MLEIPAGADYVAPTVSVGSPVAQIAARDVTFSADNTFSAAVGLEIWQSLLTTVPLPTVAEIA
eukprot:COSAG01_NODE_45496_length_409_cov_0.509677_1_plen_62_part_10